MMMYITQLLCAKRLDEEDDARKSSLFTIDDRQP